MADRFQETARRLRDYSEQHAEILVAYSGGKDSLVILDLCSKVFSSVTCYFMYFIPGLRYNQERIDYAVDRWNVKIVQYPHFSVLDCLREGVYCLPRPSLNQIPELGPFDIKEWAMHETGIDLVADGSRSSDSLGKRRQFANTAHRKNVIYPIKEWNKFDVLAYCRINDIPLPPAHKGETTGIGLAPRSLLWLHEAYPDDFDRLCEFFPYARAAIHRKQFYDIG